MARALGRAKIRWNGTLIDSATGASIDTGGVKRNEVVVGTKVHYAEETVPAKVECKTALVAGLSLAELNGIVGAVITFESDTGQTYVVRDAFLTEPCKAQDGKGGEIDLKFAGMPAEEVM